MLEWFETVAGPAFAPALMWTALALLALVVLLVAIKVFRSLTFGTFIAGGRARKARLAVLDATAVDSQRRLVLVRRDNVEHLILIGGSNDVVVESSIKTETDEPRLDSSHAAPERHVPARPAVAEPVVTPSPAASRPSAPAQPVRPAVPTPPERTAPVTAPREEPAMAPSAPVPPAPRPAAPSPVAATVAPPQRAPESAVGRQEPSWQAATPAPQPPARPSVPEPRSAAPAASAGAVSAPAVAPTKPEPAPASVPDIDDALLQELELSLETDRREPAEAQASGSRADLNLDEDMDRLLGELSGDKR